MDESLFEKSFTIGNVPHWNCPTCRKGILRLNKADFFAEYDADTEVGRHHPSFDYEYTTYVFHAFLRCNLCPEKVAFGGKGYVTQDYDEDSPRGWSYFEYYSPRFFCPPLLLIDLSNEELVPSDVLTAVFKACELFWTDLDTSANRIRTAVEYILDHLKIPREWLDGKRTRSYSLHARINLLNDPALADVKTILEAVKWIGNAGTHESDLERQQVIEGFRMLEHCLSVLFPRPPSNPAAILAVAKAVNDAKGGLSKHAIRALRDGASKS
jgi:hypothetical protein